MEDERVTDYIFDKIIEIEDLNRNLIEKKIVTEHREIYFRIKEHIDEFLEGYSENRFMTLAGLRGVGKTTVLIQIYDYLKNKRNIPEERILYFSADELKDYLGKNIFEVITAFIGNIHETSPAKLDKELFIFIDESHYDPKWSKAGKIFYDKTEKIFFIFTGSSALNIEMNVDAVRRIKQEPVFPMNFHEYLLLKNKINSPEDYDKTLQELVLKGKDIEKMRKKEKQMRMKLTKLDKPLEKEWKNFLLVGSFPFGLKIENNELYRRIFKMIGRIIEKDIFSLKSFNTDSISTISQIISYIGLQDPGGTSNKKLARVLSKSQKSIREILDVLEKTQLIFSVKPYGNAGKQIRKPWKYYFISSNINASLRYKLGKYNKNDRQFLGILAENHVATYFFKIKETENQYLNIFYDSGDNGVDFLIDTGENIIPVEVGIGKKDKKQIKKAIAKYKSKYGIIVSNTTSQIKQDGDVIYIPLISIP
ncbi:MAG: AAA family ATPase [Methanobrevibacter sp.]|jgi:predicted AAA+ superfamily ATPase|nr:AAA family ATPase [Methanobrevibacter sp.]